MLAEIPYVMPWLSTVTMFEKMARLHFMEEILIYPMEDTECSAEIM